MIWNLSQYIGAAHEKGKEQENVKLTPTIDLKHVVKLSHISIGIYLHPYHSSEEFTATAYYYEHPEAGYKERGTEHKVEVKRNNWPELRSAIDELLGRYES